jgi:hypothetical protein
VTKPGLRILGVADTDSYVKWGAATLARTPSTWDRSLVVIETPFLPTEDQRRTAVDGLDGVDEVPAVLSLAELTARVAEEQPDVVFLSMRGPMIRVVLRAVLSVSANRPVIVSGLPGISIPATKKALTFRSQVDLMVLHSKREIREFDELAERLGLHQEFGLATLPFLQSDGSHPDAPLTGKRDEIVFAVQAKVPRVRGNRVEIVQWLAECARRNPQLRVVLKLRAVGDEKQTHAEHHPYDALLDELADRPTNLVTESGSMTAHLARAIGLVTVSSTALIEAVALGIPGLALDDFGVSRRLINPVFEDSNLLGPSSDLVSARFRHPDPAWLDDNYFHADETNDWIERLDALVAAREVAPLALKRQRFGRAGGRLRHVWDRKRALGALDHSIVGYIALVVGYPARAVLTAARRTRGVIRRAARRSAEQDPSESRETLPQTRSMNSSSIDLPHAP